jgi:hypothetical protein
MRRAPAKLIAIVLAALTVSGSGIAAASAKPSAASVAHHGTEHFTLMDTLTRSGAASIIATGLFTDGGTINIGQSGRSGEMKLGRGTIRLTSNNGGGITKVNMATCLTTQTGSGTYKLIHGAGKYAGIRGSGRFTTTVRRVSPRKHNGSCAFNRPALAVQGLVSLSGSATLRH